MKTIRSSYTAWIAMISGLAVLIGGLGYYKFNQITSAIEMAESFPEHYEVVDIAYVKTAEHTPTVSVLGSAQSPLQAELFTELSGKVAFIGVLAGEEAEKGEILFQLDIAEEEARIKSAKAREKYAQSVLRRLKALLAKNVTSQEKYDQAYADLVVIQSEIEVLESTISQKTVVAPFKGIMGLHDIKLGDYVSANQMLSNFVGETDNIWVEFSVPQFYPELPIASQVKVREVDALGTSLFQFANVIAKDTQISNTTRSLKYRAEISRKQAQYTPNMPLEVLVPISDNKHVFQVPATSVNQDLYGSYVMKLVANEDNFGAYRAKRLSVQVVSQSGGERLITQGVQEGEKIAAAGAFKLYEGVLVRTRESHPMPLSSLVSVTGEQ